MSSFEGSVVLFTIIALYMVFLMYGLHSLLSSIVELKDKSKVW